MSDLLERLEEHEFPTEDVMLCLKPKLLAARDAAMARVASANREKQQTTEDDRMVSPAVSVALAEAVAAVKAANDDIQAASITLRITGVDRLKYNRFILANPSRKGKAEAFNPATFYIYVARQTAVYVDAQGETHEISDDEWAVIDKKLSDGEYDRLARAILNVNRAVGAQDISFFVNGSETTPDSSETSE